MTGKCAAGGGTESTDGANTVCTFNTSGTLDVILAGAAVSAPPVQNVIFFDEAMLPRRVIIA
jgi:hypothetical protein